METNVSNSKKQSDLLSVEMSLFFGNQNKDKRAAMMKDGAKCAKGRWVFPSVEIMAKYLPSAVEKRLASIASQVASSTGEVRADLVVAEAKAATEATAAEPAAVVEAAAPVTSTYAMRAAIRESERTGKVLKLEPYRTAKVSVRVVSKTWRPVRHRRELKRDTVIKEMGDTTAAIITTENEQTIVNPEENAAAKSYQSSLGALIRRTGRRSISDGEIIFPLKDVDRFYAARADAKRQAAEFNKTTTHWEVLVVAYITRVEQADESEVAAAFTYEVQKLLADMQAALAACDRVSIEALAAEMQSKAIAIEAGSAQGALKAAIDAARKAKTVMGRELEKKGATIAEVQRRVSNELKTVESARMMFLEFDTTGAVTIPTAGAGQFANLED